jgi:hypothetical protein
VLLAGLGAGQRGVHVGAQPLPGAEGFRHGQG